MMKKAAFLFSISMFCTTLFAGPVNQIIFFGDSLTDNGNLYQTFLYRFPKSPPYYNGRFSNGPVWADFVDNYFQNTLNVSSHNFAVGGATAILRNPFLGSLPWPLSFEIADYKKKSHDDEREKTLYIIWIGANDYNIEKTETVDALTTEVVNEMVVNIRTLINLGGKNFILMDIPDLSKTPRGLHNVDVQARFHDISQMNHQKIADAVDQLKKEYPELYFGAIDTYDMLNDILVNTDKYNQQYQTHLTNKTESCWLGSYNLKNVKLTYTPALAGGMKESDIMNSPSLAVAYEVGAMAQTGLEPCDTPDDYIFWDSIHPTWVTHSLLAYKVEEFLLHEEKNGLVFIKS